MQRPFTVVFVEDDSAVREMLAEILTDEGLEVVTASDGLQALHTLKQLKANLILLDMMLPGLDGVEFARAYHAMPGRHAPIVLLTAFPAEATVQAAAETGASAVLYKPFNIAELIGVIETTADQPAPSRPHISRRRPGKATSCTLRRHPVVRTKASRR